MPWYQIVARRNNLFFLEFFGGRSCQPREAWHFQAICEGRRSQIDTRVLQCQHVPSGGMNRDGVLSWFHKNISFIHGVLRSASNDRFWTDSLEEQSLCERMAQGFWSARFRPGWGRPSWRWRMAPATESTRRPGGVDVYGVL